MKRLVLLVLLLWILSVPGAVAAESHEATFEIKEGSVEVNEKLLLDNHTGELRFFMPRDAYNIHTEVDGGSTTFDLVNGDNHRLA
ncbi:MAG: hypothetical protein ACLFS3_03555, partial [Candidatus Aenigmatarchaeota archaeon]